MPEPFDVTRGICGTPILPNLNLADAEEGTDAGRGGAPPWPPPTPRSASPASTLGCRGCSVPESARPAAPSSTTHMDRHSGAAG